MPDQPRMLPLAIDDLDPVVRQTLQGSTRAIGIDGQEVGNIFATLARHPGLLKRWLVFSNHVLFKSRLSPRERELVILRTGALAKAEYEWAQHARIGREVGLTDIEILATLRPADSHPWARRDEVLLKAAEELHRTFDLEDETWEALDEILNDQEILDVLFTVGQYSLVAMVANSLRLQLEPGVSGFPSG